VVHLNLSIETLQSAYSAAVIEPLHYGATDLCRCQGATPLARGRLVAGQNEQPASFTGIDEVAATLLQPLSWPEVCRIVAAWEGRLLP